MHSRQHTAPDAVNAVKESIAGHRWCPTDSQLFLARGALEKAVAE
jgi:hypothetical protein